MKAKVSVLGGFLFLRHVTVSFSIVPSPFLHAQGFRCEPFSLSTSYYSLSCSSFIFHMAPRREPTTAFRTQGKRPAKPSQPKARRKARFYTTLFGSVKDYQWYKQHFAHRRVVLKRNINFPQLQYFRFEVLFTRMG